MNHQPKLKARLVTIVVAAALSSAAAWTPAVSAPTRDRVYSIASVADLILEVPEGWAETYEAGDVAEAKGAGFKLTYRSEDPNGWSIQITGVLDYGNPERPADKRVKESVQAMKRNLRGQTREKKIEIREKKGQDSLLYYYSVTDIEEKPGEFLYLTQGTGRIGRLIVIFTILSNGDRHPIEEAALEVLASGRLRSK